MPAYPNHQDLRIAYISETDPGAVGADKCWFKRSTGEFKFRNAANSGWDSVTGTISAHATSHQNGGSDEINVNGLSGTLADPQTPGGSAGGVLSGTYPNPSFAVDMATQAELDAVSTIVLDHNIQHENGGSDEINVAGLSGVLADKQPAIPGGSNSHVQFNSAGSLDGDAELIWDDINRRLRIGSSLAPEAQLHIHSNNALAGQIIEESANGSPTGPLLYFRKSDNFAAAPVGNCVEIISQAFGNSNYLDAAKIIVNLLTPPTTGAALADLEFWVGDGSSLATKLVLSSIVNYVLDGLQVFSGLIQPYNSQDSFTILTGNSMVISKQVRIASSRRLTIAGTGRLRIT